MDSGNTDDQDLDPTSSFLNPSPSLDHQNPSFYDDPQTRMHDLIWSTGLGVRSDHDQQNYFANFGNMCGAITSSSSSLLTSGSQSQPGSFQNQTEPHGHALRPGQQTGVLKNPKKRVRASNRAPTTVLKTDTTNFRQMVQEFTGFPATSLQGSPYPQRPAASFFDTLGPVYPVRPSAHKAFSPSLLNPTAVRPTTNTVLMTHDYVTATVASTTLCGSTSASGDLTNNSPQSTDQLQDHHSVAIDPSSTEEMRNVEK